MLLSGALVGLVWAGLLAIAHLLLTACSPGLNRSRAASLLLLLAVAGASATALLLPVLPIPTSGERSATVAVVGALTAVLCGFVLYMPLYYALVSSLSGQLLIRLDEAPEGHIPRAILSDPETLSQIVGPRLHSMVRSGLLHEHNGRYVATPHGRRVATLFRAVKALWHLGPGG